MKIAARVQDVRGMPGWTFSLTAEEPQSVVVTPPEGVTITADQWRAIPIGAVLHALRMTGADAKMKIMLAKLGEPPRRPHGGSVEHRASVAHVYRLALLFGAKPHEVISEFWRLNDTKTSFRWVKEAREHGVLAPTNQEEKERMTRHPLWGIAESDPFATVDDHKAATRRVRGSGSITSKEES